VPLSSPPLRPKVKLPEKAVASEIGLPAGLSLTVAVSVTIVPNAAGFGVATSVVTVAALFAVSEVELVLVRKLASPEYVAV
jgi:hypothetical protein